MRIGLGGHGDPIPTDPFLSLSEADDTQSFVLNDGDIWEPAPFIADGFTSFQVICIGAAGGFGGGINNGAAWTTTQTLTHMPDDIWDDYVLYMEKWFENLDYDLHGLFWSGGPNPPTVRQWLHHYNPLHKKNIRNYLEVELRLDGKYSGGAPGGGGLQVVTGDLVDLPESIAVVVGAAGADAPLGQDDVHGSWTPAPGPSNPPYAPLDEILYPYTSGSWPNSSWPAALAAKNNLMDWAKNWPLPHDSFANPVAGDDGAASSFGDVAKASGGKGGAPAKQWGSSSFVVAGAGGDGGVGDSDVAGGGATGGGGTATAPVSGADGSYSGGIGEGGGGGHTGVDDDYHPPPFGGGLGTFSGGVDGSDGGLGSTEAGANVYGAKGVKSRNSSRKYVRPGAGGGARALAVGYGSRADGYIPDGAVIIRVS